ncbi:MAG: hypothetical protein K9H12_08460 [Bacteroidales bacterium]|nr:hypothetical protein [Bacteroidales bacterium]
MNLLLKEYYSSAKGAKFNSPMHRVGLLIIYFLSAKGAQSYLFLPGFSNKKASRMEGNTQY